MKTVIITGASRGIGRETAIKLASLGDFRSMILTCNKNEDLLLELKTLLQEDYHVNVSTFVGNLGDEQTVAAIKKHIDENNLIPELLINNAGMAYTGLLQDMSYDDWRTLMNSDLDSVFLMTGMVIPYMVKEQKGRIINISSIWGEHGASCEAAYSAAKGAVNTFTKALAKELAPSGISVNAIAPGFVDTDMNRMYSKEDIASIIDEIPANRIATPSEIAETILLLSKAPTYMTGQIITVDGGWML